MRIVIIEDQPMFREVIRKTCVEELRHEVVGETDSGLVGTTLVVEHRPDVLLLDLSLRELDGFSVIDRVQQRAPSTMIVAITAYLDDYTVLKIDRAHIHGFIDKNTGQIEALKAALAALESGRKYFSPAYLSLRLKLLKDQNWFAKLLSQSELNILGLVGRGMSNKEIGDRLCISPRTAQVHKTNILRKLRLSGTPKLMVFAFERGFVKRTTDPFPERETDGSPD